MSDPFPEIKSKHSLVAKYVTKPLWDKMSRAVTGTSGFTLGKAIACAVQFDDQHCGIYAGDWDSYKGFADVFDPIIQVRCWPKNIIRLTSYYWSKDYHGISPDAKHESDMDYTKIKGNLDPTAPVHSTRIRVKTSTLLLLSILPSSRLEGALTGSACPLESRVSSVWMWRT